ncbi:MAG: hypothetical protein LBC93_06735 [Synergistaceae bacterium]|nr:hypothetical protein [Synergistaceae bacterium]
MFNLLKAMNPNAKTARQTSTDLTGYVDGEEGEDVTAPLFVSAKFGL